MTDNFRSATATTPAKAIGEFRRLWRFLIVGATASLLYAALCAVLVHLAGAPAYHTSVIVYLMMIPLAYTAQRLYTFEKAPAHGFGFMVYVFVQAGSVGLVALMTMLFLSGSPIWDFAVFLVTAGVSSLVSLLACRWLVFTPRGGDGR